MRRRSLALFFATLAFLLAAPAQSRDANWSRRDEWQQPAAVLDALGVHPGSAVADIGAGPGYFTLHMAARVGAEGKVYAVDISAEAVRTLRDRVEKAGLKQVEVVQSTPDDPHLPAATLDAALVVNAYHEFRRHDAMLQGILRALKPGGVLGIIDKSAVEGEERAAYERRHELPQAFVREDLERNGFTDLRAQPSFHPIRNRNGETWWFLVATKPQAAPAAPQD